MAQRAAYRPTEPRGGLRAGQEDRALKSPWARLKRVQEAEELHRKVADPLMGYKPHFPAAEAALAEGAWPDGDDLTSKCWHPLLRACARGFELKSSFDAAKFLVARGRVGDGFSERHDGAALAGATPRQRHRRQRRRGVIVGRCRIPDRSSGCGALDFEGPTAALRRPR